MNCAVTITVLYPATWMRLKRGGREATGTPTLYCTHSSLVSCVVSVAFCLLGQVSDLLGHEQLGADGM